MALPYPVCLRHCAQHHAGFASFPQFPPRPQARQTNRGPRRATMPACRPSHRNKSTGAGQRFGQAGHRRRANYSTQVFWAIACSTSWACWPIDRPQTRCFFWLLFFSAEKKSDEPHPAGWGTVPTPPRGRAPRARRRGPPAAARRADRSARGPAGPPPAPRRRAKPRRRHTGAPSRAAGTQPRRAGAPSRAAGTQPRRTGAPSRAAGTQPRRTGAPSRAAGTQPRRRRNPRAAGAKGPGLSAGASTPQGASFRHPPDPPCGQPQAGGTPATA